MAGGGSSLVDYSTEEQEIGTWIDGKKLYRKTFSCVSDSTGDSNGSTILDISGLNIDQVVDIRGQIKGKNELAGYFIGINYVSITNVVRVATWITRTEIRSSVNYDNYKGSSMIVIIEYTKTTDTATRLIPEISASTNILHTTAVTSGI